MAGKIANHPVGDPQAGKSTIAAILQELQVERIVFVDDFFELTDPEAAIAWFDDALGVSPEEAASLLPAVNFQVPERAWAEEFRSSWSELEGSKRDEIVAKLSVILNRDIRQDSEFAGSLRALFPRRFCPDELGPTAWIAVREEILAAATPERRVLCLFDQDLSQAAGFTAQGTRSGIGLLKAVIDQYPEDSVICGLISHMFSPAREMDVWRRVAAEHNLELARFLPIAKERLREPVSFAAAVKKTTLNLYCERMKSSAVEVLGLASREAEQDLCGIDVYDFDHIVLRSSLEEGVAEIETLLRIYHVFHHDRVKRAFLEPERAAQFQRVVERARPLSRIGDNLRDDRPDQRWELRHQEMFEDEHLVNAFHAPLQNGDLFCLAGEERPSLILVAQPCDLMVRSDGGRGEHGEHKAADLIPISALSREDYNTKRLNMAMRSALPYLYSGTSDVGIVEFAAAQVVRLDTLDLAVLNREGHCQIHPGKIDAECPPQFHHAWRARREVLLQLYRDRALSIDRFLPIVNTVEDAGTQTALLAAMMPVVTLGGLALRAPCYVEGHFDFGIRRVGRLREPWADRLLTTYMRFRARAADQHDFSD